MARAIQLRARKSQQGANKSPGIEDAIALALRCHRGQNDKAGAPYILHPLRVMLRVSDEFDRLAAMLHDVVEDSSVTVGDLRRAGYPPAVVDAVDCLTRRRKEGYEAYPGRVKTNVIAWRVKLADLEDNMDPRRVGKTPHEQHVGTACSEAARDISPNRV